MAVMCSWMIVVIFEIVATVLNPKSHGLKFAYISFMAFNGLLESVWSGSVKAACHLRMFTDIFRMHIIFRMFIARLQQC